MPQYTTPELVAGRLRLSATDPDYDYLVSCTAAANDLVDQWLDRTDDPADPDAGYPPLVEPFPALVTIGATNAAIKLFRGKDAAADVSETWDATAPPREARDPLAGETAKLAPYRHPRGWAPR